MHAVGFLLLYRGRDLNPHSHHWPKDFKSFVSTDSTIAAGKSGAKVLLFFDIRKLYVIFLVIFISRHDLFHQWVTHYIPFVEADKADPFYVLKALHSVS